MNRNETKIYAIKHVEHYDFTFDGKRYEVRHTTHPMPWHESQKERWTVEGGGNMRRHVCDEEGATHKRVVNALKAEIKRHDDAVYDVKEICIQHAIR